MNILNYILIFLSVVLVLFIIGQWIYWRLKRRPFTRERFAFLGLSLLSTLIIYLVPYLFGNNLFQELLYLIINLFSEHQIEHKSPDLSDKILAFLFVAFLGFIYVKIFNSWNGKKSIRQVELEKNRDSTNVFKEVKFYFANSESLRVYNPTIDDRYIFEIEEPEIVSLAWHEQVFDLLTLSSNQYKINIKKDWYQKENCFISNYGKENHPLAVYCSQTKPSLKKITDFVRFSLKEFPEQIDKSLATIIVAVRVMDDLSEELIIDNFRVKIYNESYLLNELIDFSNYYTFLEEQFEEKEIISGYDYTLVDVYTPPICKRRKDEKDEYIDIEDIEKYIINWVNDAKDKKQLAILGEYGQGKSVLSQKMAYSIVKNKELTNRIPIIIELRGRYPKQYPNSLALLSDWCSNFSINPKALLKLHYAGRLLILFEGFDEMELVGDYEIRVDHFRKLWGFSTPGSKIIITGRPNFFLNDNELKSLLRSGKNHIGLSYCEELYLKRFTREQITDALRNAPDKTKSDIIEVLDEQNENSSFYDLLSRPSSLFLTSIVWKERNISKYKNNINSALVIEEFLKHSYSRQENKGTKAALSIHERAYFMQGIAIGMALKSRYTNQISQADLKKIVLKLYNDFPEEITKQNIGSENYKKPVQKRFNKRYNEDTVLLDIRSCGILVRDLTTFDSFKFAHKSFLELLVSDYIANTLIKDVSNKNTVSRVIYNSISMALDCVPSQLAKTPDVIRFMAEHIVRIIDIESDAAEKEKIRTVFKNTYPFQLLGMESVFKLIPLLGHNLKFGIMTLTQALMISGFFSFTLIKTSLTALIKIGVPLPFQILISIIIGLLVVFLVCRLFHRVFVSRPMFQNLLISFMQYNVKEVSKELDAILFSDANIIYDRGNLLLIFLICKELNLLENLRKLMPEKLYENLEMQEKYMNRFKNGNDISEEELLAITLRR